MIAYSDHDKDLLLANTARTYSRLTFYKNGQQLIVCTEDDYLQEWDYEDYRYVPEQGFVGQFVERILDGKLINLPLDIDISDAEFKMEVGIKDPELETVNYYDYGNFLITKVSDTDTNGTVSFEACDYTKKFNKLYEDRIDYPCTAGQLLMDVCDQVGVEYSTGSGTAVVEYMYITEGDAEYPAGAYSLYRSDTGRYLNFTSTRPIKRLESIANITSDNRYLYHNYIDAEGNPKQGMYSYTQATTATGTILQSTMSYDGMFTNCDFVIENNQFGENATCRDVIKAIAQLAMSWARVGIDNKLYLDFHKRTTSNVNTYTTLGTDNYYAATKTGDTYGPVTDVVIGMSSVEGENITAKGGTTEYTGTNITMNDSIGLPLNIDLKGNTSQTGTPTPSSPINVNVVSGDNEVVVCKKNLLDSANFIVGWVQNANDGTLISNSNFTCTDNLVMVKEDTTYCVSSPNTSITRIMITEYGTNGAFNTSKGRLEIQNGGIFHTANTTRYVRIAFNSTSELKVQLEKGSAPTTYEPYTSQNYTISLGDTELCKIGNYVDFPFKAINGDKYYDTLTQAQKDLLTYGKWYLHKEVGKLILNGNSALSSYVGELTNVYIFQYPTTIFANITSTGGGLCNILSSIVWSYSNGTESYYLASDTFVFKINRTLIDSQTGDTTLNKCKTYLNNTNLIMYGPLKTAEDIEIPNSTLINQLENLKGAMSYEGQTNISQVNNDLPFILKVNEQGATLEILDNPLTYTEELRRIAINSAGNLLGLTYTPCEVDTIGYPWLDGDDYCEINDLDGDTYYTYPFNRVITYKGYIDSSIRSIVDGKVQTEYKYEGDVDRRISHTEIIVDKHEGQISLINEHVDKVDGDITGLEDKYSDVLSQVDTANTTITELSSSVQQISSSTYTKTEIQQIARGEGPDGVAVSVVSTMAGQFDINGMHYAKSGAPTQSTINQFGVEVNESNEDGTPGTSLLYAGYDYDTTSPTNGESVVKVANINISDWTNIGLHGRFQDYTDEDDNEGIGFFLV